VSTYLTAVWGPGGFCPVLLFADRTFRHRAQKTHTHPATVRRLTRWFRQQGMRGLLTDDVEVLIREHETGSGSRPAGD
jgi:hypothetical protein